MGKEKCEESKTLGRERWARQWVERERESARERKRERECVCVYKPKLTYIIFLYILISNLNTCLKNGEK